MTKRQQAAFEAGVAWASERIAVTSLLNQVGVDFFWMDADTAAYLWQPENPGFWDVPLNPLAHLPIFNAGIQFLEGVNTIAALNGIRPEQCIANDWPKKSSLKSSAFWV